jgi:hypothetical protein
MEIYRAAAQRPRLPSFATPRKRPKRRLGLDAVKAPRLIGRPFQVVQKPSANWASRRETCPSGGSSRLFLAIDSMPCGLSLSTAASNSALGTRPMRAAVFCWSRERPALWATSGLGGRPTRFVRACAGPRGYQSQQDIHAIIGAQQTLLQKEGGRQSILNETESMALRTDSRVHWRAFCVRPASGCVPKSAFGAKRPSLTGRKKTLCDRTETNPRRRQPRRDAKGEYRAGRRSGSRF